MRPRREVDRVPNYCVLNSVGTTVMSNSDENVDNTEFKKGPVDPTTQEGGGAKASAAAFLSSASSQLGVVGFLNNMIAPEDILNLEPDKSDTEDTDGDFDDEIADLENRIEQAKVGKKARAKDKKQLKIHRLKAELNKLLHSSGDESDPAQAGADSFTRRRSVLFREPNPGPTALREAMRTQQRRQELLRSGPVSGKQPAISKRLS